MVVCGLGTLAKGERRPPANYKYVIGKAPLVIPARVELVEQDLVDGVQERLPVLGLLNIPEGASMNTGHSAFGQPIVIDRTGSNSNLRGQGVSVSREGWGAISTGSVWPSSGSRTRWPSFSRSGSCSWGNVLDPRGRTSRGAARDLGRSADHEDGSVVTQQCRFQNGEESE
jgi:hypothetical protein